MPDYSGTGIGGLEHAMPISAEKVSMVVKSVPQSFYGAIENRVLRAGIAYWVKSSSS
ncbi:MAG: hypothetical protein P8X90_32785 [Desulfobacterales bacterium]